MCMQNENERTVERVSGKAMKTAKFYTNINNIYMIWHNPGAKIMKQSSQKKRYFANSNF